MGQAIIHKYTNLHAEYKYTLEIHQNTTDYSYTVDVSLTRDRNVNSVRIIGRVLMSFY